jgi:ribosomal protein L36
MKSKVLCLIFAASVAVPSLISISPENASAESVVKKVCAATKVVTRNGSRYRVCSRYKYVRVEVKPAESMSSSSANTR